jgi:NAD(P)-dependent dehydrogenase (short-subunit alcohol dehydrogenase family)
METAGITGTTETTNVKNATVIVTGASRGFGRAIADAFAQAGARRVVGVARGATGLANVRAELGDVFTPVTGDAADPVTAGELIDAWRPDVLVLNAGAPPLPRPVHRHTWETFSRNWEVDVRHAFGWVRESLLAPLAPGSTVVLMSSGAAVAGSPLSGGYAGAKATIRFLASYAADESARAGLGIRFVSLLPRLTPDTELGSAAVAAYAARAGQTVAEHLADFGPTVTAPQAGEAVVSLVTDPALDRPAYLLTASGLMPA